MWSTPGYFYDYFVILNIFYGLLARTMEKDRLSKEQFEKRNMDLLAQVAVEWFCNTLDTTCFSVFWGYFKVLDQTWRNFATPTIVINISQQHFLWNCWNIDYAATFSVKLLKHIFHSNFCCEIVEIEISQQVS